MSGFSALNLANSALTANQRALEVTGQNIANANTEGYTRQRLELRAGNTSQVYTFYAKSDGLGDGVRSDTVSRIRDAFLERRGLAERGTVASSTAVDNAYAQLETTFGEPSKTGLQSLLTATSSAWSQLAATPTDTAARTAVLAANRSLASGLNSMAAAVDAQWTGTRAATLDTLSEVNAALSQVGDLNEAIRTATIQGLSTNDLLDQRDLLVGQLATSIGASTVDGADGTVDVLVGSTAVVSGKSARSLTLGGGTTLGAVPATPVVLQAGVGGPPLAPGGTVGGQLTVLNQTLPSYRTSLDQVAQQLATTVNATLTSGTAYDQGGAAGTDLFTGTTAATITVALTDPRKIAAAGSPPVGTDASADGSVADAISVLGKTTGSAESLYRGTVTRLGVEAGSAIRAVASATAVSAQVDLARSSVSGVNLDEEMTNLMVFKQSYAAAARLVTAIDEMLDVLINRTGLVGR